MRYIGGFFELEEEGKTTFSPFHEGALALHSGRACFNYIIQTLRPKKLYIPFYCCDALLQPVFENGIEFEFYGIAPDLLPGKKYDLKAGEYFVYVNYFGICLRWIDALYQTYGDRLVIDNTQAFFEKKYKDCYSFNSARKFFGAPDGAFIYGPGLPGKHADLPVNNNLSIEHLILRKEGKQEEAYKKFQAYEAQIDSGVRKISEYSSHLLSGLDLEFCSEKRWTNYKTYVKLLDKLNSFKFSYSGRGGPHHYPFLPAKAIDRAALAREGIFIPSLWKDVISRKEPGFDLERTLSAELLPLPVDHRYNEEDCRKVVNALNVSMNR